MIKRILVPLDPSPFSKAALEYACEIAKQNRAEITGLVVLDIPGIKKSVGPTPLGASYYGEKLEQQKEQEAQERINVFLDKFEEKCKKEKIPYKRAEQQGIPAESIIKEAVFYDLVVLGCRTHFHFETQKQPGDTLDELLDHTVTPVFAVPEKFTKLTSKKKIKVLLAYDGSLPASRALHMITDITKPEQIDMTVLISHDDRNYADTVLNGAKQYLEMHGCKNVKTEHTFTDINQSIQEDHYNNSDIIAVGPHTKRGLFDFKLGSLTSDLLDKARKPILIGQ